MSTTSTTGTLLPEVHSRILEAIAAGPTAWSTPDEVISAVGLDAEQILDAMAEMDVEGLLDVWERPEGIAITLSALAAERFGYRLIEAGHALIYRWARPEDPDPPARNTSRGDRSASAAGFDYLVDPRPGPEDNFERNEQAARYQANGHFGTFRKGAGRGEPPRPTLLIGMNVAAWSGPTAHSTECPACGSRALPAHAYCLCCDRWGLDAPGPKSRGIARNSIPPDRDPGENPSDHAGLECGRRQDRQRNAMDPRCDHRRRKRLINRERRRGNDPA